MLFWLSLLSPSLSSAPRPFRPFLPFLFLMEQGPLEFWCFLRRVYYSVLFHDCAKTGLLHSVHTRILTLHNDAFQVCRQQQRILMVMRPASGGYSTMGPFHVLILVISVALALASPAAATAAPASEKDDKGKAREQNPISFYGRGCGWVGGSRP